MADFEIECSVDAEQVAAAVRDEVAALILQNARTATRFDPARGVRSRTFEQVLLIFGMVACGFGAAASLLGFATTWLLAGTLSTTMLLFAVVFVALFLVFVYSQHLRRLSIERIERGFVRKVSKRRKEIEQRVPAEVRYEIDWPRCSATWLRGDEVLSAWKRDLSKIRYGLLGDASIVLFNTKKSIAAQVILFASFADKDEIVAYLEAQGVAVERIGAHLLPETTVKRNLYPEG